MDKEEQGKRKVTARRRLAKQPATKTRRVKRRPRTTTKKQEAEKQISATANLAYLSKADLRRHINEGLKPFQHLADQAGMHFLSYLIAMAVEESGSENPQASRTKAQDDDDKD